MHFKIKPKEFLKFIKLFKLDSALYITVNALEINIKNIDFKNFLGVLEASYKTNTEIENPICVKFESTDLINKLENFKEQVIFELNPIQNTVKLYDPSESSYNYIIRAEFGPKIDKYANLALVDSRLSGDVEFSLTTVDCLEYFKIITAVENTMLIRCFKEYTTEPIQLISKKITSVGHKFLQLEHLSNYKYNSVDPVYEFQVYYPNIINFFLKQTSYINFKVVDNYLILYNSADAEYIYFKIYLPLREIT